MTAEIDAETPVEQVAFNQKDYRVVVDGLDDVLRFMMTKFGKSEDEAQAWMKDFISNHYYPVWREMNRDDRAS